MLPNNNKNILSLVHIVNMLLQIDDLSIGLHSYKQNPKSVFNFQNQLNECYTKIIKDINNKQTILTLAKLDTLNFEEKITEPKRKELTNNTSSKTTINTGTNSTNKTFITINSR
jgi:hypothetical protein